MAVVQETPAGGDLGDGGVGRVGLEQFGVDPTEP
jgi:hypothetical protein